MSGRPLRDPQRLWDLVRYMRSRLLEEELVTMDEYAELAMDNAAGKRLEADDVARAADAEKPAEGA